ncbi:hypothetical protein AZE42_08964 [Rhizopogon vesiculosus]|uniref:Uncharacterized protein n=1 Tax=Rhizopogon vesiculosus TaxID=180088 RepID=A0A1J8PPI8_9AGAM|nr:hypothetical protein AZE42_08964 [Rhizopogon vesiculosus]
MNWEFYEPGGPIILLTPGEANTEGSGGYLTNTTINGLIAQQQNGATIVIEHRFFGYSNPYDNLTSQSLALLTIQQAIDDLVYFATNADLPMPGGDANCSSDIETVFAYLDRMYAVNDTAGIQTLKEVFGLGDLGHVDDFAMALTINLVDWQSLQPYVGPGTMFFKFCDALEVKDGINAGPVCGDQDAESCIGTYDTSESYGTNTTVNNAVRSWTWMVCNQVGLYQDGPPYGQPAIVSRILDPIYHERQCVNFLPEAFASPPQPTTAVTNMIYAGWNVDVERLFFANGLRDLGGGGFHGSDMFTKSGIDDPTIAAVQEAALEYMAEWLAEWKPSTLELP